MASLSFSAPTSVDEAVKILAGASGLAKVLAGGTDLLVQLRSGRTRPEVIVDTKRIPEMIGIREEAGRFVIGASTPGVMIFENEALTQAWPGIVEGMDLIGSNQIQGRASLAGNLCNASPAADSVPALIAARATCVIAGPNGKREAPVEAIVTGPGRTSLRQGRVHRRLSCCQSRNRANPTPICALFRAPRWTSPWSACAVNVTLDNSGVCTEARVVLGAVAPTQIICEAAAKALIGHRLDEPTLAALDAAAGGRLQSDQRQARHHRLPDQGRRRAGTPRGRHCL